MAIETDQRPWKELSKEERVARMNAGRAAARASRQQETDVSPSPEAMTPSMAGTIAAEIAKALAGIQTVQQGQSPKDPKDMTQKELAEEHARLQEALEALPYVGEQVKGLKPGTLIGEGLTREYVAYSHAWFLDVETRRTDRNLHNGKPAELTWPNYGLHDVVYQGVKPWMDVSINGVTFTLMNGVDCQLPTPFYHKYLDYLKAGQKNDLAFAEPTPGTKAGYFHVNPATGMAVILGKGPLAGMAEREQSDRPA